MPELPSKQARRLSQLILVALIVLTARALSLPPAAAADAPALPAAAARALPDAITFGVRVEQGDIATVGKWLDAGLDPNFEGDRVGTGLMIAAWSGDIAMMELLVKHGADVNRTNAFKEQALMLAAWKGQRTAAAWLLEHGARINRDGNEWSALHYAAFAGHDEIAKFLMQQGADINARSTNGSTVLMMAAHEGKQKIAALLLVAGADRTVKNDIGEDALAWAMRYEHLTIAKMVSSTDEFAQAAAKPRASWGEAVGSILAPAEVEEIIQMERLAHAGGRARVLSDDEYRRVLERVAKMKPASIKTQLPNRMSINAKKGDRWREWAELQFGE
jgi:hypothetical protein